MKRREIRSIKDLCNATGLCQQEIANMMRLSKTTISLVASEKYDGWQNILASCIDRAVKSGKLILDKEEGEEIPPPAIGQKINIDTTAFVRTDNVDDLYDLCDDLLDEKSSLNASIGMVTGRAGYGKTTAARRYISTHSDVVYILWMNYTKAQLFQRIAEELIGKSYNSYIKNIKLICDITRLYRKLIVIDEADRMPLQILEDLRTLNEEGGVPLLLLGEDSLVSKVKKADRIESRIRKPVVTFVPINYLDLASLYESATGLQLDDDVAVRLVRDAHRDFRIAANDMRDIVRKMNANGACELTMEVLDAIRRKK